MDDRIREILERLREAASNVGAAAYSGAKEAGRFAGSTAQTAKLNMKIFDLRTENDAALKKLGTLVYDAHRGTETSDSEIDALLAEIDSRSEEIKELRRKAAEMKKTVICPDCGETCGKEDVYCKKCGHHFVSEE